MLLTLLSFVFVLGVLIFVHELGHFLMARRHGVRVLTFSLGFGPKVLRVERGGTEYCLSAIPLGGYVKMAGVLYNGAEVPAYEQEPPVVGTVLAGSPAEKAGIKVGDRILSVAGRTVETWEQLFMQVMPRANKQVAVVIERGGGTQTLSVTPNPQTKFEMGDIGVLPRTRPQIRSVNPGSPAERAGLRVGDTVVAVNDVAATRDVLIKKINQSAGVPLRLTVSRDGREQALTVTPQKQGDVGLIGVSLSPFEVRVVEPGPWQAVTMSVQRNLEWSTAIFQALGGLITRETSPKQLMGPVAIAQLSGGAAQAGWVALLSWMAMLSLNLGLINLLPIPVLDGGHIFIMAVEGAARRDLSMRVKEKMLLAGFLVLMVLMVTVIYNDLTRIEWLERLMPWR